MSTATPRRRSPERQAAMTERARLKAEAKKEAAAARQAEARVKELRLEAGKAPPPGSATFLEALALTRDPVQRVQTDERWHKARLLELAAMAGTAGDVTAALRVLDAIQVVAKVPLPGSDDLDHETPEGLRKMRAECVGWLEQIDTKLKELGE